MKIETTEIKQVVEVIDNKFEVQVKNVVQTVETLTGVINVTQSGAQYREDLTISSNGQTSFNLLHISSLPHLSQLSFNGVLQKLGTDYVINSSVLTWTSTIPVSTTDTLIIYYS